MPLASTTASSSCAIRAGWLPHSGTGVVVCTAIENYVLGITRTSPRPRQRPGELLHAPEEGRLLREPHREELERQAPDARSAPLALASQRYDGATLLSVLGKDCLMQLWLCRLGVDDGEAEGQLRAARQLGSDLVKRDQPRSAKHR